MNAMCIHITLSITDFVYCDESHLDRPNRNSCTESVSPGYSWWQSRKSQQQNSTFIVTKFLKGFHLTRKVCFVSNESSNYMKIALHHGSLKLIQFSIWSFIDLINWQNYNDQTHMQRKQNTWCYCSYW